MANTVYENKVLEAKAKDLLTTSVNTRSLMTIDMSLANNAGATKTINTYVYDGEVEELGIGEGNSKTGSISFTSQDYTVKLNQQRFMYHDEEFDKDNSIVDIMMKGATQLMTNKMTADFYAECAKATLSHQAAEFGYEAVVEAIAKLNVEDESKLFVLAPVAWKAELRLDPDYVAARMGEVVYNGQVATVGGLPVIFTKALTDKAYVLNSEAVKCFIKRDVAVSQDRVENERENWVYLRTPYVVALVDATKICAITKA